MKKIISVLLALVLLLSAASAALAQDTSTAVSFDPKLAGGMNYDADKWMSNETYRAVLTLLLYLQLTVDGTFSTDDFNVSNSMVAEDGGILSVGLLGDSRSLIIVFNPKAKQASYIIFPTGSKSVIEATLKDTNNNNVYTNSDSALQSAIQILQTALSDSN